MKPSQNTVTMMAMAMTLAIDAMLAWECSRLTLLGVVAGRRITPDGTTKMLDRARVHAGRLLEEHRADAANITPVDIGYLVWEAAALAAKEVETC